MSSEINGDDNFTTKRFKSAEQTITQDGSLIIPHGLPSSPVLLQGVIICKTAELGYSIGDELIVPLFPTDQATPYGVNAWADVTNINVRYGNVANIFMILNNTTGAITVITNANWKLIVRAWP